jgi:hypothetical protein
MFDSLERARIVPIIPRAHMPRGTTDKLQITLLNHEDTTVTELLNAYWDASESHRVATRACRAARRASAPDDIRAALRDVRRAAYADLQAAYTALHATR